LEYPLARVSDVSPKGMEPKELITSMGVDGFLTMSSGLFISWLEDPKIQKVWRIVCIELYHNQEIKRFFSDFIEVSAKFWESNFKIMAERKLIKDLDPKILVNEYLSYFMEAYLHYFLFSYGATKNSFQKEYKELFDQHTKFIIDSIKQQKKGGYQ
jgi:TetR/AcrR family transcriptional regulator, biofilm operon repressor